MYGAFSKRPRSTENPSGIFSDDGEWLADIMTAAYTDGEPQSAFVAENETGVIGYLIGTLDSSRLSVVWRQLLLKRVTTGFFTGGTWKSLRAWHFFLHGFWSFLRGEEYQPRDLWARFPAHFHINIAEGQRSGGGTSAGRRIFQPYARQRRCGCARAHLHARAAPAFL